MKKRNKKYLKEKKYLSLKRNLCINQETQRNLGWIELTDPQFIGYIAKLEPRQDIQNRQDDWVFWTICEKFGTTSFARRVELFDWDKKIYSTYHKPRIDPISKYIYDQLPSQVQKYFNEDPYTRRWGTWYYCTVPNFYWDVVYVKKYRTSVKIFDEMLQQEESELKSKLLHDFYDEERRFENAPKHFRKTLNRSQRAKSKQTLHNILFKNKDEEFVDNYKGANWIWW
jgi:hypothetical protein